MPGMSPNEPACSVPFRRDCLEELLQARQASSSDGEGGADPDFVQRGQNYPTVTECCSVSNGRSVGR